MPISQIFNKNILIGNIKPTCNTLRNGIDYVYDLVYQINTGKVFDPVRIDRIYNNNSNKDDHYVGDGHHRLCAYWLSGKRVLNKEEYFFHDCNYYNYNQIDISTGWFTPYNPRSNVRKNDLSKFKNMIRLLLDANVDDNTIFKFIGHNSDLYLEDRQIYDIYSLIFRTYKKENDEFTCYHI